VRAFPVQVPLILLLSFLPIACKKPQVTASASPMPVSKKSAPTPPEPLKGDTIHFTGEVNRGDRFRAPAGSNLIFALEPYAGSDSGWTIRLLPGADAKSMSMDCIGAVSEPLHGDKNVEIELPDDLSQKPAKWKPREFEFVPDPASCKTAWDLMKLVYYPSKLSDEQRAEAGEKLGKIPTAHGKFTVLQSVLRPAPNANETGSIEWLKFEVELNFPAPAPAFAQGSAQQAQPAASGGGIHAIDIEKFLDTHYAEVDPELGNLEAECREGWDPIVSLTVQYGDLDGDGQDEAVYQGQTCVAGTAGIDFYAF
jgi:hypothetical protein